MNKNLLAYEKACNQLAIKFLKSLYPKEPDSYDDWYFVADEIGGVLAWGDWFVSMNDIADYFRYKFTPEEFFDWYDSSLENHLKNKTAVNMKNFKKEV